MPACPRIPTLVLLLSSIAACASSTTNDAASSEAPVIESARSIVRRPDGRFDVICDDDRHEVVTADQIRQNEVCTNGAAVNAVGTFVCDASTNLQIRVVGATGQEKTDQVFVGSSTRCSAAAEALGRTRREIRRTVTLGVCDASTDLQRFTVTANGDLRKLPSVFFGSSSACASNASVLNGELAPVSGSASVGWFYCTPATELSVRVVGPEGTEKTWSLFLGSSSRCNDLASKLNEKRRDITTTTLLAACDGSTNLNRISITASGNIQTLSSTFVGSSSECAAREGTINEAVDTTTGGESSIGFFACDASTNLEIAIVGPAGTEKRASVFIGSASRCAAAAQKLNQTRQRIRETVLIGACDGSTNLNQFSVTRSGELQTLSTTFVGSSASCQTQADSMNQ